MKSSAKASSAPSIARPKAKAKGFGVNEKPEVYAKTAVVTPKAGFKSSVKFDLVPGVGMHGLKADDDHRIIVVDMLVTRASSEVKLMFDTLAQKTLMRADVAAKLGKQNIQDVGLAPGVENAAEKDLRQKNFGPCFLGSSSVPLGNFKPITVEHGLEEELPEGVVGVFGQNFVKLFDWLFDCDRKEAEVERNRKGLPSFDVSDLAPISMTELLSPPGTLMYACTARVRLAGAADGAIVDCMAVIDPGTARSCGNGALKRLLGIEAQDREPGSPTPQFDLEVSLGEDSANAPTRQMTMALDVPEVFDVLGFGDKFPVLFVGGDMLLRGRFGISLRLACCWVSR